MTVTSIYLYYTVHVTLKVGNIVLQRLNHIVSFAPNILAVFLDHSQHVVPRLAFRQIQFQPVSQFGNSLASETGKPSVQHQRHNSDDLFVVRPHC